jgi:hypothetical protein
MLKFDPPNLREKLQTALEQFDKHCGQCDFFDLAEADDSPDEVSAVITEATAVENIWLSDSDGSFNLTVGEFLQYCDAFNADRLSDREVLYLDNLAIVHLSPANERAHIVAYRGVGKDDFVTTAELRGVKCTLRIVSGHTPFAFAIAAAGGTDDDYGVLTWHDSSFFLEIRYEGQLSKADVDGLADAFLFELSASSGIDFKRDPYPMVDYDFPDKAEHEELEEARLRPLSSGAGLSEAHLLYLQAIRTDVLPFQIITFAKVLEYISATVIRRAGHAQIRQRLLAAEALRPDAAFIQGLTTLIQDQQIYRKDAEALKVTVQTCCDPTLLAPLAPKNLSGLRSVSVASDERARTSTLSELSECISSTRNQLSHAKANYSPTGRECPEESLPELANCMRTAAVQAIRWLESIPADQRVV